MGERYLSDCVTLLLYVERCHRFGTKHLDEYAEQLRPCVIYAKSAYSSGARARDSQSERCSEGEHFAEMIPFSSIPPEWWTRRQWTREGSVNKR